MDTIQKKLQNFIFPHLNQQNIDEGLTLLFQLSDEINNLKHLHEIEILKNKFYIEENEYLKSKIDMFAEDFQNINNEMVRLDNTNVVNMLQLTKHQLEEQKKKNILLDNNEK